MRELGNKIECTVLEIITTLMEASTRDSGITISTLEEENFNSLMEPSMKEIGKIISCTAPVSSLITLAENG
jgi:hypothetical protein